MSNPTATTSILKFGIFELDLAAGDLRKSGRKVALPRQPLELLAALVQKPGEVVTREELKDRLWSGDTYVDFDRSLNTAASKVRDALGDSASSPRFIETLPRRGYRFLASVEGLEHDPPAEDVHAATFPSQPEALRKRLRLAWLVAALFGALVIAALGILMTSSEDRTRVPLRKFTLTLPGFSQTGSALPTAIISPNGKYIAYASEENRKLAVWELESDQHRVLQATDRAMFPFWSPDSESIGFWAESGGVKRVELKSGLVTVIAKAAGCCASGAWSPDGDSIVFGHDGKLFEVSTHGGDPREVREWPEGDGSRPAWLPDTGRRLVLFSSKGEARRSLNLLDIDTGEQQVLYDSPHTWERPIYSPSGHLICWDRSASGTLWAFPFSLSKLRITGQPFVIAQDAGRPSVAADQTLLFEDQTAGLSKLVWIDRQAQKLSEISMPGQAVGYFSLSPNGAYVASYRRGVASLYDVERQNKSALVFPKRAGGRPVWSRSGKEIFFSPWEGIYIATVDGSEEARSIYQHSPKREIFLSDSSRDGRYVLYDRRGRDVWYLERDGESGYESKPYLTSEFTEKAAVISADNRWVAYVSDESGGLDVYLRRFPGGEDRVKISQQGGRGVRWGPVGDKLYYRAGQTLYEVDVSLNGTPEIGLPRAVLEWPGLADFANVSAYHRYDVSADEEKFVVIETLPENHEKLRLVQNWYEEFRDSE